MMRIDFSTLLQHNAQHRHRHAHRHMPSLLSLSSLSLSLSLSLSQATQNTLTRTDILSFLKRNKHGLFKTCYHIKKTPDFTHNTDHRHTNIHLAYPPLAITSVVSFFFSVIYTIKLYYTISFFLFFSFFLFLFFRFFFVSFSHSFTRMRVFFFFFAGQIFILSSRKKKKKKESFQVTT